MTEFSTPADQKPRRDFLSELAVGAAALAAAACAPAAVVASATPATAPRPATTTPPTQVAPNWDTSWLQRLTGKHKAVFDSPEIEYGTALFHAHGYLQSVKDVFGGTDADASVVVVLRHSATVMVFNDAMWAKYEIGKTTKTTDSRTKKPAVRNTFWQSLDANGNPVTRPTSSIQSLISRGVTVIGCNLATRGFAYSLAEKTKQAPEAVYEELRSNLLPGTLLMPTGVFATLVAQESGASFIKST
jgi:hypothetical protein